MQLLCSWLLAWPFVAKGLRVPLGLPRRQKATESAHCLRNRQRDSGGASLIREDGDVKSASGFPRGFEEELAGQSRKSLTKIIDATAWRGRSSTEQWGRASDE
ncbi:hypothetical protein BJY01DRAFT_256465 [Aspergillus pseudoustus]|uniref:Secreted protein n=1 Tax=Aspergillus pseudoustus TaxID=1810923 RepID=A0ABR4IAX9_9EURO